MSANFVATTFGKNLLRERRRAGISQEELSHRAGLHRTEIGLLERGERIPRIDTAIKLAGGVGAAPGVLLEGIGWESGMVRRGQFRPSDSDQAEV